MDSDWSRSGLEFALDQHWTNYGFCLDWDGELINFGLSLDLDQHWIKLGFSLDWTSSISPTNRSTGAPPQTHSMIIGEGQSTDGGSCAAWFMLISCLGGGSRSPPSLIQSDDRSRFSVQRLHGTR